MDELRDKIQKDAKEIYYTLDIDLGILKFYKAEILIKRGFDF